MVNDFEDDIYEEKSNVECLHIEIQVPKEFIVECNRIIYIINRPQFDQNSGWMAASSIIIIINK